MLTKAQKEAYKKAENLLLECATPFGFKAAKSKGTGNYDRVWSRDSMICSLAALKTNNEKLIKTAKASIKTLANFQHHQGEIPSNVNPKTKEVSFGGSAGRVDANLWFLIGVGQYVKKTKDLAFAKRIYPKFKKTIKLIRAYEFNHKSLIYVPMTGDWADEYIQEGQILYDQLLYLQAFKEYSYLSRKLDKKHEHSLEAKIQRILDAIKINYWPIKKNANKAYNKVVFLRSLKTKKRYMRSFFNPGGYGENFDLFANSLAILMGVTTQRQSSIIKNYIKTEFSNRNIPAFYPVIDKKSKSWVHLESNYGKVFRNKPYEYHNGGIWPMVMGFYVAALGKNGGKVLDNINELNSKNNWEFNEVFHGKTLEPNGTKKQAWSAAGTIIATNAVKGGGVFS